MGKKEYMEILLSQIRNDKAKELVGQEIEAHIDDQAEVYMEYGIDADTAEKKAVRSMGDPVETGVSLDRIHKPKMSWGMIMLVAILSIAGLIIQGLSWAQTGDMYFFHRQIAFVAIGFVCMLVICFIDYSFFVQRGQALAFLYLVVTILFLAKGTHYNGTLWLHLGGISFTWHFIMYLSIPIFGILLYQYRKQQKKHLLVPVAFMVFVGYVFYHIGNSRLVLVNIIFMAAVVLTYAIAKNWYPVHARSFLTILWACLGGCVVAVMTLIFTKSFMMKSYVIERIGEFVSKGGPHTVYGGFRPVREILSECLVVGGSQIDLAGSDAMRLLSDYVLLHVVASYGVFLLVVIIALLAFFCCKLFQLSIKQKNQVGTIIGIGCGLIFTVQIAEYILMNLGLLPGTTVFLPLFSYGGSGTVVSYILLGLLLSIYRYQNLVTEKRPKKRLVVKWEEA